MFPRISQSFLGPKIQNHVFKRAIAKIKLDNCPKPLPPMNVTITGAASDVGQMAALLLKQKKIFKNLFLYDTLCTKGIACDLGHMDTRCRVTPFMGIKRLQAAITNARIILICGGNQIQPGFNEKYMFERNAQVIRQICMYCAEFNPRAAVVIVSSPISCLVPMAVEEYKKADVLAHRRIFGLSQIHVSRANALAGQYLYVNPARLNCPVVGGTHRRTVIPVLSQLHTGKGIPACTNEKLTRQIQEAGEDTLHEKHCELNAQGCFLSLANAAAKFTILLARALNGEPDIMATAYVKQKEPMDQYARYLTTSVLLGKNGIVSYHMPRLSQQELNRLKLVTEDIRDNIHLGESYVTGNDRITAKHRPKKQIILTKKIMERQKMLEEKCKEAHNRRMKKRSKMRRSHPCNNVQATA